MSIVDEIQKMLQQESDLNDSFKKTMKLQQELLSKGIIQQKRYNLPMAGTLDSLPKVALMEETKPNALVSFDTPLLRRAYY